MVDYRLVGTSSGNGAEVDTHHRLKAMLARADAAVAQVGGIRGFSELDQGLHLINGSASLATLRSPEADKDYRLRVSQDIVLDEEVFCYTAQNTGKHNAVATNFVPTWSAAGYATNPTSGVSVNSGCYLYSYAWFSLFSTASLRFDWHASFSATPTLNTVIDFGLFERNVAAPYLPTDGCYFRLTAAGLQGVTNFFGNETTTAPFNFVYTPGTKYQFVMRLSRRAVQFWIGSGGSLQLYGTIITPQGNLAPCGYGSLPVCLRHATAALAPAGGAMSMLVSSYCVTLEAHTPAASLAAAGNRVFGSYQGLVGQTAGSLAFYTNSSTPVAGVPTNTTVALSLGLGGQNWETATLAVNTDGILFHYLNPTRTANQPARRLIINGISLSSWVQTAITTGPYVAQYSLSFGGTGISLATGETSQLKAPRRIALPPFTQAVSSSLTAGTRVPQVGESMTFLNPIVVEPNQYVQIVTKHIGTAATAGTIAHLCAFDYGWE